MRLRRATALLLLGWAGACSDSPGGPSTTIEPLLSGLLVSDPAGAGVGGAFRAAGSAATANEADSVVYVSLSPGTRLDGVTATVRAVTSALDLTTAVLGGGFDPVPVTARVGDTVEVIVRDAAATVVLQTRAAVLAARRPIVVRTDPPPKKRDVPLNSAIILVFSEPIAGNTLASSSVQLFRGPSAVAGTVSLLGGTSAAAVFTPAMPLAPNTDYRLVVTQAVRDLDGDALAAGATAEFTTGRATLGAVAQVDVWPDSLEIAVGSQVQLTAAGLDAQGNVVPGRPITWYSTDSAVATVSATGLVTAVAEGFVYIGAEVDGQPGGVGIGVSAALVPIGSVTVTPESTRVAVGGTLQLLLDMRDTAGRSVSRPRPTTWTSSNPALATVAQHRLARGALVTGVGAGIAKIWATVEGKSDTAVVAVGPPGQIIGIVLAPESATVVLNAPVQLAVFGRDTEGFLNPIDSTQVTWTSSNPSVAAPTGTGLVTGLQAGSATITGTWSGHQATASVTVVSLSFASISAGGSHTCGVTSTGAAFCWGYGAEGQLGTGTTEAYGHEWPEAVAGGHVFTTVAVNWNHTCGLAEGGMLYCWGWRYGGREVCLNGPCSTTPVAVGGSLRFRTFDVGDYICGLTDSGAAYCWLSASDSPENPVAMSSGMTFATLDVGASHACALTPAGAAYCWGGNYYWQLGSGDSTDSYWTPRAVAGGLTFSALSAGQGHTCGLSPSGAAYCWGRAPYWSTTGSLTPRPVMPGVTFVALSAGAYHTCGIDATGATQCWNDDGPLSPPPSPAFANLDLGVGHHCGVTAGGTGYCWGYNWAGQLGNGTTSDHEAVPVKVAGQP